MQNTNFIDWSDDFEGAGRVLYNKYSKSEECYNANNEEIHCDTGKVKNDAPAWLIGVIIGFVVIAILILAVCTATKCCTKECKCSRLGKNHSYDKKRREFTNEVARRNFP